MILLYHKVAATAPTQWWVTADAFARQLADLAAYDVVYLSDYDSRNPRHVAITFDGVYENVHQFALPLLRKWGYPFELFVTGDCIGGDNAFDTVEPHARFCTLEQLDALAAAGGRIQWHTATHRKLQGLDPATLAAEIEVPAALRQRYGAPHFDWFAYPHGDHDPAVVDLVRRHYAGALSCVAGDAHDRHQLNRVTVVESSRFARRRVSVIVANHNYGALLPEAMESVLAQTVPPDEIILVDDASTDGSAEVARRYENVARVVVNPRNLGIVANFNHAVGLASGDYIAFLGADNRMRCDYVEQCRAALDRDERAAVAYTDMAIFGHRAAELAQRVGAQLLGESRLERWPVYLWRFPEPTPEAIAALAERNFLHGSSMYRRAAFDQVGGYRESGGPEDHNLFVRMVEAGWGVHHVAAPLIEYRQHAPDQANTLLGMRLELARLLRVEKQHARDLAALAVEREQREAFQARKEELDQALLDANARIWTLGHEKGEQSRLADERAALIAARDHQISLRDAHIAQRDGQIAQRDGQIAQRDGHLLASHAALALEREQRAMFQARKEELDRMVLDANARIWTLDHARGEQEQLAAERLLELDRVRQHIDHLHQDNAHLAGDIGTLQGQLADLTARHERAVRDIHALVGSRSWKITRPIRFAALVARGERAEARRLLRAALGRRLRRLPPLVRNLLSRVRTRIIAASGLVGHTSVRLDAVTQLVAGRMALGSGPFTLDVLRPPVPADWPELDLSMVTHNNGRWLAQFADSVLALDYPRERLHLHFVDNQSTNDTPQLLQQTAERLRAHGLHVRVLARPNRGFGAGHNAGVADGSAPFALVTNIDLVFEPGALKTVVATALVDARAAAWELRQKPYEHPKFYDPVTGATNWNAHACVLLRRQAFDAIGGYDDNLFMYGEDVELSYRLRRAGWVLRYVPAAAVTHYAYESAGELKPLQHTGSTFANLYLRLKYGTAKEAAMAPLMAMGLLALPQAFPGARRLLARSFARLAAKAPLALAGRRRSTAVFPFQVWDYEIRREGAFVEGHPLPAEQPLVTVVTRTYQGRERLLRQAMLSVAHQTWPALELVVVQDGGDSLRATVEEVARATGLACRFIGAAKLGRSATGNTGLAAARGRWCMFLDDDDLLFADHVETLAHALLTTEGTVAAYSPAWEVETHFPQGPAGDYEEKSYTVPPALLQDFEPVLLRERNFMTIQSVLFERTLFEERGGFDTDMDALEDWVLWNVYADGNRFAYVPKVTSLFRTPADTEIRKRRNDIFAATYEDARARIAERLARLWPDAPPHAEGHPVVVVADAEVPPAAADGAAPAQDELLSIR